MYKPKIMYKPNRNVLSQTSFEKAKIENCGLKRAKLATLFHMTAIMYRREDSMQS